MRRVKLLCVLIAALVTTSGSYAQEPVNVQDSLALVDLYDSTNGPDWDNKVNYWKQGPVHTWYGVEVTDGRVTELHLPQNNILGSVPESFGNLTMLNYIVLRGNPLSALPASFGNLINLDTLFFEGSHLSSLPESFGNLTNLQFLSLSSTQLTSLPESFGKLMNLQFLALGGRLSSLPESFGNLMNLKRLGLGGSLSSLPESFGNLKNLEYLGLSNNHLTSLPASFGDLNSLQQLYLEYNQLSSLPESFGNLMNLQSLFLHKNQLTSLPASFGNLSNLNQLQLSTNQLTSLPASFGNLTNLEHLSLSQNQLTSLPAWFGNLISLRTLSFQLNSLSTLPESFGKLTNIIYLFLGHNQISSLPESFSKLTGLEILDLTNNQLSSLPESIGKLTNLRSFSLGYNQLSSLPESIGNLTKLERLYLRNNQLSNLPESVGNLTSLQQLILDTNRLSSLPQSLGNLTNLQYLYLYNNQLSALPESLKNLIRLFPAEGRLYLEDNKFRFGELELIVKTFPSTASIIYAPQDTFKLIKKGNTLIATVGGTLQNNNFTWYRDDTRDTTITGDSTYTPTKGGNYRVNVHNVVVRELLLQSDVVAYPLVNIKDVTIYESDGKAKVMVHIERPMTVPLRLSFKTVAGSATAHGPLKDYTSRVGYVKIRAGMTSGKIRIPIRKDTLKEGNETFYVVIRKKGFREDISVVGRDTALVTILDGNRDPEMVMVEKQGSAKKPPASIPTASTALMISASPNPGIGPFRITIHGDSRQVVDLTITNALGMNIDTKRGLRVGQTIEIGRSYLAGTYFLTARTGTTSTTITLIRQ